MHTCELSKNYLRYKYFSVIISSCYKSKIYQRNSSFRIIHRQKNQKEGSRDLVDDKADVDASEEEQLPNQSSGQSLWSSSAAPLQRLAPGLFLLLSLALIVQSDY